MKNIPLIVILGETATGKTELAIEIAKRLNGEIINADSWIIRKEANIGTAKPSLSQQRQIKHYLIDCISPDQEFTVAGYKKMALDAIDQIYQRNKIPIIVGGSGLYINSIIFNYSFRKDATDDERKRSELNALSLDQLKNIALNKKLDLESIDSNNKRRLIRLIETNGAQNHDNKLRDNTILIGIKMDRSEHRNVVINRVEKMINNGLKEEVKYLSQKYGWDSEICKGVGYRQWKEYFDNQQDLELTKLKIVQATINLAKKQRTWFKKNNYIKWFNYPLNIDEIIEYITTHIVI